MWYTTKKQGEYMNPEIEKFCRLINCPTVSNAGDEPFHMLHREFEKCFPLLHKNLQKYNLKGNALLYKWEGKKHNRPLVLMAHQDVVDVDRSMWNSDPFKAEVRDGYVFGRGTIDCKNVIFAIMTAVERLLSRGEKPEQDIYISLSDNEEIGGEGCAESVKWFKEHKIKPVVSLDEGGAIEDVPGSDYKCAMIGVLEKGYMDVIFIAENKGGHSSQPGDNQAIDELAKVILKVKERYKDPQEWEQTIHPVTIEMYKNMYPNDQYYKDLENKITEFIKDKLSADEHNRAIYQTTLVFTMMNGSSAPNIIPSRASVLANIRLAPWDDKDRVEKKLKEITNSGNINLTVQNARNASKLSDFKSEEYKKLSSVIKDVYEQKVGVAPFMLFGGTDSRTMEECVDYAFRCTPLVLSKELLSRMHGNNECIPIDSLLKSVDFFEKYILAYC